MDSLENEVLCLENGGVAFGAHHILTSTRDYERILSTDRGGC